MSAKENTVINFDENSANLTELGEKLNKSVKNPRRHIGNQEEEEFLWPKSRNLQSPPTAEVSAVQVEEASLSSPNIVKRTRHQYLDSSEVEEVLLEARSM